jgi:prolyl oligopeptidase
MPLAKLSLGFSPLLWAAALAVLTFPTFSLAAEGTPVPGTSPYSYPPAPRGDVVDDYHGQKIADPYRWLEDLDAPETRAWIEAENKLTESFLDAIPARDKIRAQLEKLWNYERFGLPVKRGERYFFTRNDGLQNQSVLYVTDSLAAAPRLLLDPNTLSQDGTVALTSWRPSEDGQLLAYGLAEAGSDWQRWQVLDVATGKPRTDDIRWVKFSGVSWLKDGSGFFYSRYDEPQAGEQFTAANYYHKLYFHKLGTPQADDQLIYERPDEKEWGFGGSVSEDGQYLVIHVWRGSEPKNLLYVKKLAEPQSPIIKVVSEWEAEFDYLGNEGTKFWIATDWEAPQRRVMSFDLHDLARDKWRTVVPEAPETLTNVNLVGERIVCSYLHDVQTQVKLFSLTGQAAGAIELPAVGTASGFGGKRKDRETFYMFSNLTTPATIYRYDFDTQQSTVYKQPKIDFDSSQYVVRQVFYPSRDGTKIPMFLAHRKDLQLDGKNPTLLYGYGGFNVSLEPWYSVTVATWLDLGGVYAVANLRGGGEYGRPWHDAGKLDQKQNVFDDFIAAGEWLIENKYTSREKLAIRGGSNGGLLVGACLTQRPDLYAAALPGVGVLDMLRFHKFTIGRAWTAEYGSSDDAAQFPVLRAYSPLHNIHPGTNYPATLITTGDHDDRVVPAHSYKFAAELQRAQAGPAPILIRIDTSAGHGAGKPTQKLIDETADWLSFLVQVLKMDVR